jgi:putative transport protein
VRAYKLSNKDVVGWTVRQFLQKYPQYKVLNVARGDAILGVADDLAFQAGDVIALGGRLEAMTENMGLIGPEVPDAKVLSIPLDQAEILVTNKEVEGKELGSFRTADFAGQLALVRVERAGEPIPIGLNTKLQRFDVLFVAGLKSGVNKLAEHAGKIARPSTATDLLTLSVGMILGFLIGAIAFPVAGSKVGLGNAGGLLVSGIIVSSVVSRLRFFGNTPNAARNILEDLGLLVFIAIVGINAGAGLVSQLSGTLAIQILVAGFVCTTIPPILVWAIGYHLMKINPAVLMGGVAGARSHSGPAREAAKEINSSVPWIGFPVGYAVSGVILTVFGYVAMVLSK